MSTRPFFASVGAMLLAAGCAPFGGTPGELGHGEFFYQCVAGSDAVCDHAQDQDSQGITINITIRSADGTEMPRAVAIGAPFGVIFQADPNHDGTMPAATVEPASTDLAVQTGLGFSIVKPGTVSFLAVESDGTVLDFIDVVASSVDSVHVFQDGSEIDALKLVAGDEIHLGSLAMDPSGVPLSGSLAWSWKSTDDSVALVGQPSGADTSIHALAKGTATITATVAGKSLALPVTVMP